MGAWTISPSKFQGWTCQRIARQCSVSGSFGRVTKLVVRIPSVYQSYISYGIVIVEYLLGEDVIF